MRLFDVRRTFVEFTVSHSHLERHCDVVQKCILCGRLFVLLIFRGSPNGLPTIFFRFYWELTITCCVSLFTVFMCMVRFGTAVYFLGSEFGA